ncbi:MAG: reverse transcriptase-like protein, partial [Mycobacterium sp.]
MKVIVEADGGSRGNPGPAGYGSVVWTADRSTVLAESKQAIGVATNNVAEYRGLIAGLADAAGLGATEVAVSMDSKLVVEQMSGRWQIKHPDLRQLNAEARALASHFERISYRWIPRAENSHADRLANEAMDAAAEQPALVPETTGPPGWTGASGTATRLLLLRHGQTELSVQRRYSGRGNPALT